MRKYILYILMALTMLPGLSKASGNKHNVVILGDSNTWIGGDDCDKETGWNKWFKDYFAPATCKSYSRSGATWTNTKSTYRNTDEDIAVLGDNNVIYNQVCRLENAVKSGSQVIPDIIIIACGTNDAWFTAKRPGIFNDPPSPPSGGISAAIRKLLNQKPSEVTSLVGSIYYSCSLLHKQFPKAKIILLTPLQSVHAGEAGIKKVGDIIQQCGKRLGYPVIRQDKLCCVRYADEVKGHHFTSDGTHTNVLGAERNGKILAEEIKKLVK